MLIIGGTHTITPDIVRNAIVDADRRILDFRLRQTGPEALELVLPRDLPSEAIDRAMAALVALFSSLGLSAHIVVRQEILTTSARKLRRVERVWRG